MAKNQKKNPNYRPEEDKQILNYLIKAKTTESSDSVFRLMERENAVPGRNFGGLKGRWHRIQHALKNPEYGLSKAEIAILKERVTDDDDVEEEETASAGSLNELTEKHNDLNKKYNNLKEKHEELEKKCNFYIAQNNDLLERRQQDERKIKELENALSIMKADLQQSQSERRQLHNKIQDLKGNIRVSCRVRPANEAEQERLQCNINFIGENGLEIRRSRESVSQVTGKVQELKSEFMFDKVFTPTSTQEELFEDVSQLIQSALDGYDVCVSAYGQTGTGKTYTMQGGEGPKCMGIIPRSVDNIFENIKKLERLGWEYKVQASFLEIYNENIHDLLNRNSSQKLEIYYDGKETTVTNLTIKPIESASELMEYMSLAQKNRATASTDFNEHSSRSHAVTKIYLEGTKRDQNVMYKGSVNLVDLAGSESAKQSVKGKSLDETKHINKSVATLGDVISALQCKPRPKHIPFRNSKLTRLLQSCLEGNSKTLMIVNICPLDDCFRESLSSLRFGAKAKEVKTRSKKNKMAIV